MKKGILLAVVAALLITPAAAVANHGKGGKSAPKVTYVLKGTLSSYTPYNNSIYGPANGSITILVSSANHHGKALKHMSLTFAVGPNTKISLENAVTTITDGDKGIVKVRAAKRIAATDLAATLQATIARQIVDQGVTS